MRQLAIYGKGGIGKSMVSSHISFGLADRGLKVLRAEFAVDVVGFNKIQGQTFKVNELVQKMEQLLEEIR